MGCTLGCSVPYRVAAGTHRGVARGTTPARRARAHVGLRAGSTNAATHVRTSNFQKEPWVADCLITVGACVSRTAVALVATSTGAKLTSRANLNNQHWM